MNVVVVAVMVSIAGANVQSADPYCDNLSKAVERIRACNNACNFGYDAGDMEAARALGEAGPTGCNNYVGASGRIRVGALANFLLSTSFANSCQFRAAIVASLGNISKANGFIAMLALVKESEYVMPTDMIATPIWGYIGQVGKDTGLLDLAAQALIRAEDRGGYGGQRQGAVASLVGLAKYKSSFDQWRPIIACLKRAACDRYPDVKYVATSGLQDLGQFPPKSSQSGDCYPCGEPAAAGTACYAQVLWAMSTGVKEHPDWYPGLNASSPFADFQRYLFYLPTCGNPANPPCYAGADPCPNECPMSVTNAVIV